MFLFAFCFVQIPIDEMTLCPQLCFSSFEMHIVKICWLLNAGLFSCFFFVLPFPF